MNHGISDLAHSFADRRVSSRSCHKDGMFGRVSSLTMRPMCWATTRCSLAAACSRSVCAYNYAARFPTVSFGFSSAAPAASRSQRRSCRASPRPISHGQQPAASVGHRDVSRADLPGAEPELGFVGGIPNDRNYAQQRRALHPGQLALEAEPDAPRRPEVGVFSPVREDNNLAFVPVLNGRSTQEVMLDPNAAVSFVNGDFYKKDLNNFGPVVGVAWDPFKDGKTSVRGGYSLTFVNEEAVTVGSGIAGGNAGLSTAATLSESVRARQQRRPGDSDASLQGHAHARRPARIERDRHDSRHR